MYHKQAQLFKALSDPNRLRILELLIQGETCGCTLIDKLPIGQPTLSYHLKQLADAGLTRRVVDGTKHLYYVEKDVLTSLRDFLASVEHSTPTSCEAPSNG